MKESPRLSATDFESLRPMPRRVFVELCGDSRKSVGSPIFTARRMDRKTIEAERSGLVHNVGEGCGVVAPGKWAWFRKFCDRTGGEVSYILVGNPARVFAAVPIDNIMAVADN